MHSSEFKSAKGYRGKKVVVVGACNSGMSLFYQALDLPLTTCSS